MSEARARRFLADRQAKELIKLEVINEVIADLPRGPAKQGLIIQRDKLRTEIAHTGKMLAELGIPQSPKPPPLPKPSPPSSNRIIQVLKTLYYHGPNGATSREISAQTGMPHGTASSVLSILNDEQKVTRRSHRYYHFKFPPSDDRSTQAELIVGILRDAGPQGLTSVEMEQAIPRPIGNISAQLSKLKGNGTITSHDSRFFIVHSEREDNNQ